MHSKSSFPRAKAKAILKYLDIRHPKEIEVKEIAYTRGLVVRERVLEGSEGLLVCNAHKGIASVNIDIPELGKKRFTIAHELGHFELHRDSALRLCDDSDFLCYEKTRPGENEANEFATELLMPEYLFQSPCKSGIPCFSTIGDLADDFRTSLTATAIRYVECSPHRCAIVVSRDGSIKWYRASEDFGYHVKVGSQLGQNSYAIDFFNGKGLPLSMELVLARSWLDGEKFDWNAEIKEQSMAIPRYNIVLSLLWIDDDIDDLPPYGEERPEYDPDYLTPDGKRWRW